MLNQHFSTRNFMRLMNTRDVYKYSMGNDREGYAQVLSGVEERLLDPEYAFARFKRHSLPHGDVISPGNIVDDFALRKLNDNVKRVFNVRTADRNRILPQIKILLSEEGEFWIQKLDVSRFFESIPKELAFNLALEDSRLSFESKRCLQKLLNSPSIQVVTGLPRGISLSSTLSELYMKSFDEHCRRLEGCYFYVRYVDDIFMMFYEDPGDLMKVLALPEGLSFNIKKCIKMHKRLKGPVVSSDSSSGISYLGYHFDFKSLGKDKPCKLEVGVSEKKIKKIKTRVCRALFEYCRTLNFALLKRRLIFLASNYDVGKDSEKGRLFAGVYFNNHLLDRQRFRDLEGIDKFIQCCVFSRSGSLGRALAGKLNQNQRRELCRISLMHGFQEKVVRKFSPEELLEIKGAWAHV